MSQRLVRVIVRTGLKYSITLGRVLVHRGLTHGLTLGRVLVHRGLTHGLTLGRVLVLLVTTSQEFWSKQRMDNPKFVDHPMLNFSDYIRHS